MAKGNSGAPKAIAAVPKAVTVALKAEEEANQAILAQAAIGQVHLAICLGVAVVTHHQKGSKITGRSNARQWHCQSAV